MIKTGDLIPRKLKKETVLAKEKQKQKSDFKINLESDFKLNDNYENDQKNKEPSKNSISLSKTSSNNSNIYQKKNILTKTERKKELSKNEDNFSITLKKVQNIEETENISEAEYTDISQFTLMKVIGRGTFGKVILVKSKLDDSYYALKCLKKLHILETNNLTNLKNEKQILQKTDNPFIIKLRFTFQNKEKIFLGFDYHNGGELFFHLQKSRRFSEETVKFYAAEIYCALVYLHSKGIIYR